jgi:hypothetical protein
MEDTDKVLEQELGELGGEFGGLGARWAARRMPNNAFGASIELDISTGRAFAEFSEVAGALGRVIGHAVTDTGARLTAVIGAGFWNLNPAVVDLRITPLGSQRCRVVITGTAKEGLIKQRAGEGAVRKFLAATRFGSTQASDISER